MPAFFIGLDSWIIQDGNYADCQRGQVASFAVEFYPERAAVSRVRRRSVERIAGCRYRINAKVVFACPQVWVIDFGIMAYDQQSIPPFAKVGTWIDGEINLGIDPFFYFEDLHKLPGMPELRYDWRIERIRLETTPWLSTKRPEGGTLMERDITKESFREVERTNAWEDDDRRGSYELECERIGEKSERCAACISNAFATREGSLQGNIQIDADCHKDLKDQDDPFPAYGTADHAEEQENGMKDKHAVAVGHKPVFLPYRNFRSFFREFNHGVVKREELADDTKAMKNQKID